jgi:hypothetical protein
VDPWDAAFARAAAIAACVLKAIFNLWMVRPDIPDAPLIQDTRDDFVERIRLSAFAGKGSGWLLVAFDDPASMLLARVDRGNEAVEMTKPRSFRRGAS